MILVYILGRGKDFKVKWIAQIVQFFFFFTIREERSAKATQ